MRVFAFLVLLLPALAAAQTPDPVAAGEAALAEGRWRAAERLFTRALEADPDDLAARYGRARARYEQARVTSYAFLPLRYRWEEAVADFEAVLAADSTYPGALYGLARLWADPNAQQYDLALGLADALARQGPPTALDALRIYRAYAHGEGRSRVVEALFERASAPARVALGDLLRQEQRFEAAAAVLQQAYEAPGALPASAVLLALARLRYAQDQSHFGQALVERAIGSIDGPIAADAVFDEVAPVVSLGELAAYDTLATPAAWQAFFEGFWNKRDPLPGATENARLTEHYRRLLYAERYYAAHFARTWHHDPSAGYLHFPPTYALDTRFDDRGLIFLRHGEPTEEVRSSDKQVAWWYADLGIDFYFASSGGGWRFRAVPSGAGEAAEDLAPWGGAYAAAANDALNSGRRPGWELDAEFLERSPSAIAFALTTDRHTWTEAVEAFEFPALPAAFRGADGQTDLNIYYALPTGRLTEEVESDEAVLHVELGCALQTPSGRAVNEFTQPQRVPLQGDADAAMPGVCAFTAAPGRYRAAAYAELLNASDERREPLTDRWWGRRPTRDRLLGATDGAVALPDLSGEALLVSDLVPALAVEEAEGPSPFNRGGLHIRPNPVATYAVADPVRIYAEVYNLTFGADDRVRYRVAYRLERLRSPVGEALQGGAPALEVEVEQEAPARDVQEVGELDVSALEPGRYRLVLRITDAAMGQSAERSRTIALVE